MKSILDLSYKELSTFLEECGEPSFRVNQVWRGIYQNLWDDPNKFSNLPISLRSQLDSEFTFTPLKPVLTQSSRDNKTKKTLFHLQDAKAIETVLMEYDNRRTICISTQVGCGMNCAFCATGKMGFARHLTSGEIISQVLYLARNMKHQEKTISNIVFMGMGEPFHNYDNTMSAIDRLNDEEGFNFGARRFTVSTVGLVPGIRRFTAEKRQVNLAISLHAASDDLRGSLIPIAKIYLLDELFCVCHDYVKATRRRISFEWALIYGVNDTSEQAYLLAERLTGLLCHVNIILLNPTAGYHGKPSTLERAMEFNRILTHSGIPCTIRLRRGIEIQAGCGQLVVNY